MSMTDSSGEQSSENPPSNIPDAAYVVYHSELTKIEADEERANNELKAIRARKRKYRKTMQGEGVTLSAFDEARAIMLQDQDEAREHLAEVGRIVRAFKAPIGHQFDLFEKPGSDLGEKWRFDGYRAGTSGKGRDENPHARGDDGFKPWDEGWLEGQKVIVAGMADIKPVYEDDETEPPADEPEQTDIEDALPVDDADPIPESEDDALKGIEA